MWCVSHPTKPRHTLVLLDTEGLGDVEKGDENNDTWIFCLAVLLSSVLVYNSVGTINNVASEKINYVSELANHIKVKDDNEEMTDKSTELLKFFPSFVWAVRDFSLILEVDGMPITADDYLTNSLKLKGLKGESETEGKSSKLEKYNRPQAFLRALFPVRKCFVFERPANTQKMRSMETLEDKDLDPSFVRSSKDFCDYVNSSGGTKTMAGGLKVTGIMLANLAVQYTKAIASNEIPCLSNAVESLAKIQNGTALTKALEHYQSEMAQKVTLPTDTKEVLSDVHKATEKEAIKIFMSLSFKDEKNEFHTQLKDKLDTEYLDMCKKNTDKSQEVCRNILALLSEPLEQDLNSYMRSGGHSEFRDHLQKITQEYKSKRVGFMSEEVLKNYLEDKASVEESILCADLSLTNIEQQHQVERLKREAAEQAQAEAEEHNKFKDQMLKDQKESYEEHMKQLDEKIKEEREFARMENEKIIEIKNKELEALRPELASYLKSLWNQIGRFMGFC